jgi:hypothetical protein
MRARRHDRRWVVGALVLVLAVAAPALAGPSGLRSPARAAALERAALAGAASRAQDLALVAPRLGVDEQATVAFRPSEARSAGATHALGGSFQEACPDRTAATIVARAERGSSGGGIARWCLAHATATQAP